jgi:hypothetical protein
MGVFLGAFEAAAQALLRLLVVLLCQTLFLPFFKNRLK